MKNRWATLLIDIEMPAFNRETGERNSNREYKVLLWACPNADLDDFMLEDYEYVDHDVVPYWPLIGSGKPKYY